MRHGCVIAVTTYLFYPCPQEAADQELEALEFGLDNDELEVGLGIHVARLVFNQLNLAAPLAHGVLCMRRLGGGGASLLCCYSPAC